MDREPLVVCLLLSAVLVGYVLRKPLGRLLDPNFLEAIPALVLLALPLAMWERLAALVNRARARGARPARGEQGADAASVKDSSSK